MYEVAVVNRYGRRGGRGFRPWLLLPKVIAVGAWVGGLAAVMVLLKQMDQPEADRATLLHGIEAIERWVLTPALTAATLLGIALLLQHPGIFLRTRWVQLKLLLIFGVLAPLWRVAEWRMQGWGDADSPIAADELSLVRGLVVAALAVTAVIVVVGRHKPRLGQRVSSVSSVRG